jgi:hypothetical protein
VPYPDRELFHVVLELGDDYQILVTTPWRGRRPEEVADTPASRTGFRSSGLP